MSINSVNNSRPQGKSFMQLRLISHYTVQHSLGKYFPLKRHLNHHVESNIFFKVVRFRMILSFSNSDTHTTDYRLALNLTSSKLTLLYRLVQIVVFNMFH